jgi:hypothetical protein
VSQGDWLLTHWIDFPLWLAQIGAHATVGVEVYIATAIWFKRTRISAMLAVVLLHLSMTLTLRVSPLFHLIMMLHLCLFVRADAWRALGARWKSRWLSA